MLRTVMATAVVLGAATGLALAATDAELRLKIVGYWSDNPDCHGAVMVFRGDGSMVQVDFDTKRIPPMITMADGTFEIADGRLSGTMNGQAMPTVGLRFEDDRIYFVEGRDESYLVNCPSGPR
ncbi:MAG: hypothetical protein U1E56_07190 [Bauldia sp.]